MAADAYLKSAAAHLRSAASQLVQDMHVLRSNLIHDQQQKTKAISKDEAQIKIHQAEMAGSQDQQQKQRAANSVRSLQQDVQTVKKDLQDEASSMSQMMDSKQSMADNLQNEAKALESKAGATELR